MTTKQQAAPGRNGRMAVPARDEPAHAYGAPPHWGWRHRAHLAVGRR